MVPDDVLSAMRGRFENYRLGTLRAATLTHTEAEKHLRLDFYFDGTSEDVDFDELEAGLVGELIADIGLGIETVGFAAIFDEPSAISALLNPARLYPRPNGS